MREKFSDKKNALSLIESSKKDLEFTFTLKVSEDSANTIIRNVYESFRILGEALLIYRGISTSDHIEMINEIINLRINSSRPLNILDNLRRLRHNINYYAYRASKEEAQNILDFAKENYILIFDKINNIIENRE
jgi:hypothetical protein